MATDYDTAAQMRFLATVRRQSAPPRCNPFVIVLQVLALGVLFIGVTMTLIAHWPGSTSIGENPLKIAGPVLLVVGFVALIIGIVLVCVTNRKEQRRWQKQMATAIMSRSNADLVGGNDESQMQGNSSGAPIYKPKPDTRGRPNSGTAEPHYGYRDDHAATVADTMVTDGDNVPMPVRVTKARRLKDRSGEGADISMSSTEDLTAPGEGDEAGAEKNAAPKKRRRPKPAARPEEGEALISGGATAAGPGIDSAAVQPSPGEARRLKVHIKAQPGASVRIQNAPPPVAPKPAYKTKPHDTSTETDI